MSEQNQNRRPSFYKKRYLDQIDSFLNDLLNDIKKDDPSGLRRLLDFYSTKFQRWSPSNIVGIFIQKPKCERPVTVSEAKALGHTIKPGVPRATILVPVFKPEDLEVHSQADEGTKLQSHQSADNRIDGEAKQAKTQEEQRSQQTGDNEEAKLKLVGFKVVPCVVDLGRETEGPPLLSVDKSVEQKSIDALLEALGKYAGECSIVVDDRLDRTGVLNGATGIAVEKKDGSIHISTLSAMEPKRRFGSLVHELTHGLLHLKARGEDPDRQAEELQAAGVSYFVGKHFGVGEEFSALYLKNWGVTAKDILKNLAVIVKAAREISEGITRHLAPKEEILEEERVPQRAAICPDLDLMDEYEVNEVLEIVDDTDEHFSQVVYVYHAKDFKAADTVDFNEENYTLVARCERSNLADAFGETQNIEGSWAAGGDVDITVYGQKRQRSSSVDDVFFVEGDGYYKVNWDGWSLFKDVDVNQKIEHQRANGRMAGV